MDKIDRHYILIIFMIILGVKMNDDFLREEFS